MRPETGNMRFGKDWTGVFIRGDSASYYGEQLGLLLESVKGELDEETSKDNLGKRMTIAKLEELSKVLKNCHEIDGNHSDTQIMKDIEECKEE